MPRIVPQSKPFSRLLRHFGGLGAGIVFFVIPAFLPGMETYTKKTSSGTDILVSIHVEPAHATSLHPLDASLRIVHSSPIIGAAGAAPNPRPTVLLFGWYAASKRNLAKYETIYHAMGYNSVATTAPTSITFFQSAQRPFILSVLRVLATDPRLLAGGLVLAPFSNAGAILLPLISRLLCDLPANLASSSSLAREIGLRDEHLPIVDAVRDATAALVLDSCPCYLHADTGANALLEGLQLRNKLLSAVVRAGFFLICMLQLVVHGNFPARFWRAMRDAKYPCPELYMYSAADTLLDEHALDELVAYRRETGCAKRIEVWRVEDAAHVMLLRTHRQQYISRLRDMNDWGVNAWRKRKFLPEWSLPQDDFKL
jgi:Eukaryotic protein of unknown function (DUF829)